MAIKASFAASRTDTHREKHRRNRWCQRLHSKCSLIKALAVLTQRVATCFTIGNGRCPTKAIACLATRLSLEAGLFFDKTHGPQLGIALLLQFFGRKLFEFIEMLFEICFYLLRSSYVVTVSTT